MLDKILNINKDRNDIIFIYDERGRRLIKGSRGHNSCFFKKPIIEGCFYM